MPLINIIRANTLEEGFEIVNSFMMKPDKYVILLNCLEYSPPFYLPDHLKPCDVYAIISKSRINSYDILKARYEWQQQLELAEVMRKKGLHYDYFEQIQNNEIIDQLFHRLRPKE